MSVPLIVGTGAWRENGAAGTSRPEPLEVECPADGSIIAKVEMSVASDVDAAVKVAKGAYLEWANLTIKRRATIMMKFHELCDRHSEELVALISKENGKNKTEAQGDLAKGLETVEWAMSMPQIAQGKTLPVSGGVYCQDFREPVGVVTCIVPCNFPFMVPMWTVPIALVSGNAVILKPSEKVPMTMSRVSELLYEAGVPKTIFQMINGGREVVDALCDHKDIAALTFVGSSNVAEIVYKRAINANKKALCLGGAKNHLVAAPDCEVEMASSDIVVSFSGCAGQRCMAAAVLLVVGEQPKLLERVCEKAKGLKKGQDPGCVGPVIDKAAMERIRGHIDRAEKDGAEVLVDGRSWSAEKGYWVGPTVLKFPAEIKSHPAYSEEIFGPVLCVRTVKDFEEALQIENADPHGNAACIYTQNGQTADWFSRNFSAAMIGVNIGVPVPREPFSFGGLEGSRSKFGEHDITGEGAMNFFTKVRKVTTKWTTQPNAAPDLASFAGVM
mmetsp:Transcript_43331/g.92764  ORF Transcript_43331/g.92764 Transcript_43331/m.92764 type:complete len:500 (-) Transcript_43331:254-1753(-)|eukprot:CAMPEP_0206434198 /NCGR_PEP_ID=MMETSP0324_2-20121206/9009_1 /ASSEMBLY_ACC=CAM_ASM_000836 /TAXON_ID=2866 /ORGANISM="Crypthecodinium cohnii, Strain Seligo" /LENGTH=499 /DNA_ID=CAMNT_0053900655 /DNA_START=44 /DNA_END=1543 /DNA_ORIENTATION=+